MKVQALLLRWQLCQTKKETSLPGLVAFQRMSGQGVLKGQDSQPIEASINSLKLLTILTKIRNTRFHPLGEKTFLTHKG